MPRVVYRIHYILHLHYLSTTASQELYDKLAFSLTVQTILKSQLKRVLAVANVKDVILSTVSKGARNIISVR